MSGPEGVGPLASLDRRDPLQGFGSLAQCWKHLSASYRLYLSGGSGSLGLWLPIPV